MIHCCAHDIRLPFSPTPLAYRDLLGHKHAIERALTIWFRFLSNCPYCGQSHEYLPNCWQAYRIVGRVSSGLAASIYGFDDA